MYPNNPSELPTPQTEYSIDYLDQISGVSKARPTGPSKLVMIIVGAVGVISVIIFAMLIFSSGTSVADKASDVYLRLQTLQSLASDNQKALRNNDLRAINSGLDLQLTNALAGIEQPLANASVNTKKISKTLQTTETEFQESIQTEFDDAELNVQLDSVYAREMSYQLANLRSMMQSTAKSANSESLKTFLVSADDQLAPFADKFADFTNS